MNVTPYAAALYTSKYRYCQQNDRPRITSGAGHSARHYNATCRGIMNELLSLLPVGIHQRTNPQPQ